jgi:hypothetical protein
MQELIAKPGYVRCGVTFLDVDWQFEVMSEEQKVLIVTLATPDGPVDIAMNRIDAMNIAQRLQLFLADWPLDQATS